jgi:hypothetical protein
MKGHDMRFLVARGDLHHTRWSPDPDAPDTRPLAEGEVRLQIEQFALTANNITYAAFGEAMKYWQFFPTGDAGFGCIPVWGFASVAESRCAGVEPGQRVYGYLPMGSHLVVQPERVGPRGFIDAAPHRADLAAAYNRYEACAADPLYRAEHEGLQALLRPLFTTSFLLDDFLAGNGDFGASRLVLSSASSKTAFGTAFCVGRRSERPTLVGLTSKGNLGFVRSLGCYDEVLAYDDIGTLDPAVRSVYVDFAGSAPLRRSVHEHLAATLAYSCAVGGSHWEQLRGGHDLPGPAPQLFFAPAQAQLRAAPPPQGWGGRGLEGRIADAWLAFIDALTHAEPPWLTVRQGHGADAIEQAYRALLAGGGDPREGLMLALKLT